MTTSTSLVSPTNVLDHSLRFNLETLSLLRDAFQEILLNSAANVDYDCLRARFELSRSTDVEIYFAAVQCLLRELGFSAGANAELFIDAPFFSELTAQRIELVFILSYIASSTHDAALLERCTAYLCKARFQCTSEGRFPLCAGVSMEDYSRIPPETLLRIFYSESVLKVEEASSLVRAFGILRGRIQSDVESKFDESTFEGLTRFTHRSIEVFFAPQVKTGERGRSGMFSLYSPGGAILSAGPCYFPLGEFSKYGVSLEQESEGVFPLVKISQNKRIDIGWINHGIESTSEGVEYTIQTVGDEDVYPLAYALFIECDSIEIEGVGRIPPRSLSKYQNTARTVYCKKGKDVLSIASTHQGEMQVIPLSGGAHFFGATYLLGFILEKEKGSNKFIINHFENSF